MIVNIPKPEISPNFTVEDIRNLRNWYDAIQEGMTSAERVADMERRGEDALRRLGLDTSAKRLEKQLSHDS
jgi:hypothetical protein